MSSKTIRIVILAVVVIAFAALAPSQFTVVDIEEQDAVEASEEFDPVAYVDGIWEGIFIMAEEEAVDLALILNGMEVEENVAGDQVQLIVDEDVLIALTGQFGLTTGTGGKNHLYWVKMEGTVTTVDTGSSIGTVQMEIDGYDGPIEWDVYIGPRLPSNDVSVTEAFGLALDDFENQPQWGSVGKEVNDRIKAEILADLDREALEGVRLTIYGAFDVRTKNLPEVDGEPIIDVSDEVHVVPVIIEGL